MYHFHQDHRSTDLYLRELSEHLLAAVQMALLAAGCVLLAAVCYVWATTLSFPGLLMLPVVAMAVAFAVLDKYRENIPRVPSMDGLHDNL